MEVTRFGPGNRREVAPPGSQGVSGQVIFSDDRARVSELAFQRYAMVSPHSNPNTALFVVISGGGFVQVGAERSRINHGEAVVWPPDVPHGAYTDGSEMRAIVVELADDGGGRLLEGRAVPVAAGEPAATDAAEAETEAEAEAGGGGRAQRADGALAERQKLRDEYDAGEGEPW